MSFEKGGISRKISYTQKDFHQPEERIEGPSLLTEGGHFWGRLIEKSLENRTI